ncbi:uncharacterized protein LOC144756451 [Lissotriton helveticus]
MESQGSPALFTQMSQVEDSLPDASQAPQWAAFMRMAKRKGLAWVEGLLKEAEEDDSGVICEAPLSEVESQEAGPTRFSKRAKKQTSKEFPPDPPAAKSRAVIAQTEPPPKHALPGALPGVSSGKSRAVSAQIEPPPRNSLPGVAQAASKELVPVQPVYATREDLARQSDSLKEFMRELIGAMVPPTQTDKTAGTPEDNSGGGEGGGLCVGHSAGGGIAFCDVARTSD